MEGGLLVLTEFGKKIVALPWPPFCFFHMMNQQRFSTPFPVCAGTLAPARELPGDGHSKSGDIATANIMYFLTNPNLSVPVVAALAVIVIAIAVICVLRSRQNSNNAITKGSS